MQEKTHFAICTTDPAKKFV